MEADHSHERRLSGGTSGASDQLPSLTPLRGVAALWVVLYHYCGTAQFLPNLDITPHSYLISKGYLAVDMFFILSGFVMAHVYRRTFSESVSKHIAAFLWHASHGSIRCTFSFSRYSSWRRRPRNS